MSSGLVALGPTEFSAKQNTAWRVSLKPCRDKGGGSRYSLGVPAVGEGWAGIPL